MDEQVKATTADAHKMRDYIKNRIRVHDEDEAHQRVTIDFLQVRVFINQIATVLIK